MTVRFFAISLLLAPGLAIANEQEIQRAIIQRDQQTAEFAAGVRDRQALETLHARQRAQIGQPALHSDPNIARELQPYERHRMAQEREHVLQLPPPAIVERRMPQPPAPLPGLPEPVVQPVKPGG